MRCCIADTSDTDRGPTGPLKCPQMSPINVFHFVVSKRCVGGETVKYLTVLCPVYWFVLHVLYAQPDGWKVISSFPRNKPILNPFSWFHLWV